MPILSGLPLVLSDRPLDCRDRNALPVPAFTLKNLSIQPLLDRLVDLTNKIVIGDPTDRNVHLGPVINESAYQHFQAYCKELSQSGRLLTGGKVFSEGVLGQGVLLHRQPWRLMSP